jgi:two-component system, OmpR family, response regulator
MLAAPQSSHTAAFTGPAVRIAGARPGARESLVNRSDLRTVLYVDDEADIREIVGISLGLVPDLSVHTCESGERALELLPQIRPDIILLDVMMPHMDGPATLKQLRATPGFAHTPVAFITAKAMPQEVARFKEMGAVAVIAKPFDPLELGKRMVAIWEAIPA